MKYEHFVEKIKVFSAYLFKFYTCLTLLFYPAFFLLSFSFCLFTHETLDRSPYETEASVLFASPYLCVFIQMVR